MNCVSRSEKNARTETEKRFFERVLVG